jgi:hypothetical protein
MLGIISVGQLWGFARIVYFHTNITTHMWINMYVRAYIYTYKNAYIHAYVTNSTEKRSSWEADRYTTSQESPSTRLSEAGSSFACSKIPPLGRNLSQLNPVIISSSPSESNLICSYSTYPKYPLVVCLFYQNFVYINILLKHINLSSFSCVLYVLFTSSSFILSSKWYAMKGTNFYASRYAVLWHPSHPHSLSQPPVSNTRNLSCCRRATD